MIAYKREEMISITDLLKGFKNTIAKLSTHELDKVAVMKNNKPEAVILSIDEYERLCEHRYWNTLDEKSYLQKAHTSLYDTTTKTYSIDELEQKLEATIKRYES